MPDSFDDFIVLAIFAVLVYGAYKIRLDQNKQHKKEEENVETKQTSKSK